MYLSSSISINLFVIAVVQLAKVNTQDGYSYSNSDPGGQIIPTKHPNSHYSRLVSNDYSRYSSSRRRGSTKQPGNTRTFFSQHHQQGGFFSGFPFSLHPHHPNHPILGQSYNGYNGQGQYNSGLLSGFPFNLHPHHPNHPNHPVHGYSQYQQQQYYPQVASNPCYYRNRQGKNAEDSRRGKSIDNNRNGQNQINSNDKESGRTLWDLNVFNVHGSRQGGCDDLYSDPGVAPISPQNPGVVTSFVSLFSDGGPLNPNGGRPSKHHHFRPHRRPPPQPYRPPNVKPNGGSPIGNVGDSPGNNGGNSDGDIYDPVYENQQDRPVYENQYDDQINEGPQLSPGEIVGGIAHTVNGVIQTLSGNGPSRSSSFLRRVYQDMQRRRYNDNYYH